MKMKCPNDVTSVSWGGEEYKADSKGYIDVPSYAVADLLEHGLEAVAEKPGRKAKEESDPVTEEQPGA
jgi:hypothetical protein